MIIQRALIFVASWILLSAFSQIVMKIGLSVNHSGLSITSFQDIFNLMILYKYLFLGCGIYLFSMIVYFIVLTKFDISIATSIGGGLTIVVIALLASLLLGETISPLTWIGIITVVIGVSIIGISSN